MTQPDNEKELDMRNERVCENGHRLTGIGFDDECPECEGKWINEKNKGEAPEKKCEHQFIEDEVFSSGAVMIFGGSPSEMSQETRVICQKCDEVKYIPIGQRFDLFENL